MERYNETVPVTREDIEQGRRGSVKLCPISLALKRKGYDSPQTYDFTVSVTRPDDGKRYVGLLPSSAQGFIDTFDADGKKHTEPDEFVVGFERECPG
jgi:hypothetical protein